MSKKLRLYQILRQRGIGTVKEALDLIRSGSVLVNGALAKNPNFQVNPNREKIEIKLTSSESKQIDKTIPKKYFMLNKPIETMTTTGKDNRKTVMDLFNIEGKIKKTLFPVGRLDYKTTGLLIITNDGNFAHKLLSPKSNIEKEYHAVIKGRLSPTDIKEFEHGVIIDVNDQKYKTQPAKVSVIKSGEATTKCSIIISEGKKRQVRLMFLAVGHKVLELERVRIGKLTLSYLKPGEYRELSTDEVKMLQ